MKELEQAEALIRKSLSEEEKAISDYLERKQIITKLQDNASTDEIFNQFETYIDVLNDIIAEEQVHVGQLRELLTVFELPLENEDKGKEETVDSYTNVLEKLKDLIGED